MIDLGKTLRGLRLSKGYTQQQVADFVKVTKSMISAYENGLLQPSYEVLIRIASLYKVSTDFLLGNNSNNDYSLEGLTSEQIETVLKIIYEMEKANNLIQ